MGANITNNVPQVTMIVIALSRQVKYMHTARAQVL